MASVRQPNGSGDDVGDIANTITRQYRENGCIPSRAISPPQGIEDGAARIQVIEGCVVDVTNGGDAPDNATVRRLAGTIVKMQQPTRESLKRHLSLVTIRWVSRREAFWSRARRGRDALRFGHGRGRGGRGFQSEPIAPPKRRFGWLWICPSYRTPMRKRRTPRLTDPIGARGGGGSP